MSASYLVIGHFPAIGAARSALRRLREEGFSELEYYAPFPCHELDDQFHAGVPRSPVRRLTLLGGILGCLGGFLMTCWMSLDWPIRTSAKPVLSYPAFVVIAFECTILLGGVFTLLAMLHYCRLPNLFIDWRYRPTFSEGTFGVVVRVPQVSAEAAEQLLTACGARKTEVQYVR